jgi:structural maintenance of chromosomes protein 5
MRGLASSVWKYNGVATTQQRIKELVQRLGIQVNNLCTFLPQEKVGAFTEMDAKQLLVESEKALENTKLTEKAGTLMELHQELIRMQE